MGKPPFRPGDKIKDYLIAQEFIVGPLGAVYTVRGKPCLIKAPLLEVSKSLEKFRRAVSILQSLQHPNIQNILDSNLDANIPWIAIERLEGNTLRQIMQKGTISILNATRWMYHIASAIGYAHIQEPEPVLHRLLRPEFIGFRNNLPMILDLGLAEFGSTSGCSLSNEANMLYLAPELFDIRNKLDTKAEVYALGVIFYELLSGRPPFGTIEQVDDEEKRTKIIEQITNPQYPIPPITDLPKPLPRILQKALHRDRQYRYVNAEALANDIKAAFKDMLLFDARKAEERSELETAVTLYDEAVPLGADASLAKEARTQWQFNQRSAVTKWQADAAKFRAALQSLLQLFKAPYVESKQQQSLIKQVVSDPNSKKEDWQSLFNELQELQKILLGFAPQELQAILLPTNRSLGQDDPRWKLPPTSETIALELPLDTEAITAEAVDDSVMRRHTSPLSPTSSSSGLTKVTKAVKPTPSESDVPHHSSSNPSTEGTNSALPSTSTKSDSSKSNDPASDNPKQTSPTEIKKTGSGNPLEDATQISAGPKRPGTGRRTEADQILQTAQDTDTAKTSANAAKPIELPVCEPRGVEIKPGEVVIKRVIKSDAPDKPSKAGKDDYGPKVIAEENFEEDVPTLVMKSVEDDEPKVLQKGLEANASNPSEEYEIWIAEGEKPSTNDNEPMPRPNIVLPKGFNWVDDQHIVNEKDGGEMVYIPAGTFIMGSEAIHAFEVEKPEHEVYLDDYFMDVYPITWKQYLKFCDEMNHPRPQIPEWGMPDDHPVVNITWQDAVDYCNWSGKALPSEAQWEKASRGGLWLDGDRRKHKRNSKPRRTYPWGDDSPNADGIWRANYNAEPRFGKNRGSKSTSPVTTFPIGKSPYGVMDLAGNVWEWASDWFSKDYYRRSPRHNPIGPDVPDHVATEGEEDDSPGRVLRGGSWYIGSRLLRVTARRKRPPDGQGASCGMRCVLIIK